MGFPTETEAPCEQRPLPAEARVLRIELQNRVSGPGGPFLTKFSFGPTAKEKRLQVPYRRAGGEKWIWNWGHNWKMAESSSLDGQSGYAPFQTYLNFHTAIKQPTFSGCIHSYCK